MDERASTRPIRQIHPPRHYDEYEMGFVLPQRQLSEPITSRHGHEEELSDREEGAVNMTFPAVSRRYSLRDADDTDRAQAEKSRLSTPSSWSSVQYHLSPASQKDLQHSRDEPLNATLAEIREARSELRLLAETVRSLKRTTPPAIMHSQSKTLDSRKSDRLLAASVDHGFRPPPPCEELIPDMQADEYDDTDWPDPPPWPETGDPQPQYASNEPIVDLLDKMMDVFCATELIQPDSVVIKPGETLTIPCKVPGASITDSSSHYATA
ncbi:immunoglobulin heavy chain variable region [Clarias magur]|nr:immunoglobulin heavy chain variable region [Clarias magur]